MPSSNMYTDFGSDSYPLDEDEETSIDVQSDRHQVLIGLGLRF